MDVNDYITASIIGCQQKSKEEIFNDWVVWSDQYVTATQTKNALLNAVNTWYVSSTIGNSDYKIPACQTDWNDAYYTQFWDYVLDYTKKSNIFWNSLSGLTGDGTQATGITSYTFCRPALYQTGNIAGFSNCSGYTVDYTNKLTITEQIHDDYTLSLKTVMRALKNLMQSVDLDTFVDFNPSTAKLNSYEEYYLYNRKTN